MKIGIFVLSLTGNTYSVAQALCGQLQGKGYECELVRLRTLPENAKPGEQVKLEVIPSLAGYDAYVFASLIMAFHLPPIMKEFMQKAELEPGRKAVCFVTQHLPYAWLGGSRGIRKLRSLCRNRQVEVVDTGVINWSRKDRQARIDGMAQRLADRF